MAYSNFTLETARKTFHLKTVEAADIFADVEPVAPSTIQIAQCDKILGILTSMVQQKA